jgi:hypothetical protein
MKLHILIRSRLGRVVTAECANGERATGGGFLTKSVETEGICVS